jgi:hypothetical protein
MSVRSCCFVGCTFLTLLFTPVPGVTSRISKTPRAVRDCGYAIDHAAGYRRAESFTLHGMGQTQAYLVTERCAE